MQKNINKYTLNVKKWGEIRTFGHRTMFRKNVTSILFDGYTPPVLTWLLQEHIRIAIIFILIHAINLTIFVFNLIIFVTILNLFLIITSSR